MTRRVGRFVIIHEEEPQQCDDCGNVAELRPYGPGGSKVCFPCAMKTPDVMDEAMRRLFE